VSIIICTQFISCKKGPARIEFRNLKCCEFVYKDEYYKAREEVRKNEKLFEDYYTVCKNGITKKPGIIISAELEKEVGSSKVTAQILEKENKYIMFQREYDVSPDFRYLETPLILETKGKYIINILVKDKIIAQGEIEYRYK
jgi:hypothetical protein